MQASAQSMTWQYGYDAMGRPTTVIDPNGQASYTYYDSLGRPIQTQQPANTGSSSPTVTGFTYNSADGLTQVTDPRNLATTYSPNGLGDVTAQTSPDTGASQYTYDALGNMLTKTDARGKLTQYTYDSLDRLKTISYATGTGTVFEYDGGSTPTPAVIGELTKITDASGQMTYSYDSLGRKTGKIQVTGAKTFTVGYTWGDTGSALDKLTAITYPSGTRVNYSYDSYGEVSGITVNPPNANGVGTNTVATLPLLSGITTNAESKITGWTWASGKAQGIAYDGNGQISAYNLGDPSTTGVRRTLARDNAGRITAYTHVGSGSPVPSLDQGFGYDNLNRLTSATLGGTTIQYSYDATGNRTTKVIGGTTYTNIVAANSNRYTQIQDITGTATVTTDAAGNITGDGLNTYAYSDRGRMATMTNAGGTVSYSYNALELRVGKSGPTVLVPTGATYYVYDEQGKLLGEYDADSTPLYETIYLGLPVGVIKQTGTAGASNIAISLYNVSTDQIGAPRVITRQSDEAIVWRWDSAEVFGATAPDQNPAGLGVFSFNLRLPGQTFDAESGLFQNWNREYCARCGRYIQSDPIGLTGGINTYAYVTGSPLSFGDPSGLQPARTVNPSSLMLLGAGAGGGYASGGGSVGSGLGGATAIAAAAAIANATDSSSIDAARTVADFCPKCQATATRSQAEAQAYAWAGISPGGGTPIPWTNFNPPGGKIFKKSRVWADFMRQYGPKSFGASSAGGAVEEHPFGHPNLPGGLNHDCPHFVAVNSVGVVMEFPYKPGSP
jgi:RHS repeat-associated protein